MSQFTSRRKLVWTACVVLIAAAAVFLYVERPTTGQARVDVPSTGSSTPGFYDFLLEPPPGDASAAAERPDGLGRYGDVEHHNRLFASECCVSIAHAGGSHNGKAYTNSLEALDSNYRLGRRVFEIDFLMSTDDHIVLVHHWDEVGNTRLSRDDFLARDFGVTPMDFEDLARWLLAHPDATIITDTKDDFGRFVDRVEQRLPPWFLAKHFVFQAYGFEQLDEIEQRFPGMPVILTIYKMEVSDAELGRRLAENSGDIALTIPLSRALKSLATLRRSLPTIPIYIHGRPAQINAPQVHSYLQELGASGFYVE